MNSRVTCAPQDDIAIAAFEKAERVKCKIDFMPVLDKPISDCVKENAARGRGSSLLESCAIGLLRELIRGANPWAPIIGEFEPFARFALSVPDSKLPRLH